MPLRVMAYDPSIHHRRSVRLRSYDYAAHGAYFVTICVHQKRYAFGRIENGLMRVNQYGSIAHEEWQQTGIVRPDVVVDEFIIMPNHVHGILIFTDEHSHAGTPTVCPPGFGYGAAGTLGTIIGQFKSIVTKRINQWRVEQRLPTPIAVWQRSFYERIIREENELNATRRYITENPLKWHEDEHYSPCHERI